MYDTGAMPPFDTIISENSDAVVTDRQIGSARVRSARRRGWAGASGRRVKLEVDQYSGKVQEALEFSRAWTAQRAGGLAEAGEESVVPDLRGGRSQSDGMTMLDGPRWAQRGTLNVSIRRTPSGLSQKFLQLIDSAFRARSPLSRPRRKASRSGCRSQCSPRWFPPAD